MAEFRYGFHCEMDWTENGKSKCSKGPRLRDTIVGVGSMAMLVKSEMSEFLTWRVVRVLIHTDEIYKEICVILCDMLQIFQQDCLL